MAVRDFRGSLKNFNLYPASPEQEELARIEQVLADSVAGTPLEEPDVCFSPAAAVQEGTLVYDKFNKIRRHIRN